MVKANGLFARILGVRKKEKSLTIADCLTGAVSRCIVLSPYFVGLFGEAPSHIVVEFTACGGAQNTYRWLTKSALQILSC